MKLLHIRYSLDRGGNDPETTAFISVCTSIDAFIGSQYHLAETTFGLEPLYSQDAETVAESSAFVVLRNYGIDTGSYSFPYVARWTEDKAVLRRNLAEVQGVAVGLIAGIEEAGRSE